MLYHHFVWLQYYIDLRVLLLKDSCMSIKKLPIYNLWFLNLNTFLFIDYYNSKLIVSLQEETGKNSWFISLLHGKLSQNSWMESKTAYWFLLHLKGLFQNIPNSLWMLNSTWTSLRSLLHYWLFPDQHKHKMDRSHLLQLSRIAFQLRCTIDMLILHQLHLIKW